MDAEFALGHNVASIIMGRELTGPRPYVILEDEQLHLAYKYSIKESVFTDGRGTLRLLFEFTDGSKMAHRLTAAKSDNPRVFIER